MSLKIEFFIEHLCGDSTIDILELHVLKAGSCDSTLQVDKKKETRETIQTQDILIPWHPSRLE
jgi:hypothetical protein